MSRKPLSNLRQNAALYQGTWKIRANSIPHIVRLGDAGWQEEPIAKCPDMQTAEYLMGLHEWCIPLLNTVTMLQKKVKDLQSALAEEQKDAD